MFRRTVFTPDQLASVDKTIPDCLGVTLSDLEQAIGDPWQDWAYECHSVSIAIVRSGVLGQPCRVARGVCPGVFGQHSWVVLGDDCYDEQATIVDTTLWSYDLSAPVVYSAPAGARPHRPHGQGHFMTSGMPYHHGRDTLALAGADLLSAPAQRFLRMIGPLDAQGWMMLANLPVLGWPAAEIIAAMLDTPQLAAFVPIDREGMLTDRNPSGLYLAPTAAKV